MGIHGRRKFLILFIFVSSLIFSNVRGEYNDCRIISSSNNHLLLEFVPADWHISDLSVDKRNYKSFDFNEAVPVGKEGQPQVPVRIIHIGVPLKGEITAQIVNAEFTTIADIDLLPVPGFVPQEEEYIKEYSPDQNIYNSSQTFPESLFELEPPDFFRAQRRAKLIIKPLRYIPAGREVHQYTRIVVRINFSGGTVSNIRNFVTTRDDNLYKYLLVNYEQAKKWRQTEDRSLRKSYKTTFSGDNWYKFTIKGNGKTISRDAKGDFEGIYKIDGATLKSAGIPIESIDPSTIQLFNNGGRELPENVVADRPDSLIENAILVGGGEDGKLNDSDYILFYGRSLECFGYDTKENRLKHYLHRYTEGNVYFITYGKQKGKRIQTQNSLPVDGVKIETSFKDLAYFEREEYNVFNSGPIWLDRSLSVLDNSRSYTFNLHDVISKDQTVFHFSLANISTGSHTFTAYANGNKIGNIYSKFYSSSSYRVFEDSLLNYSVLMNGTNTVSIDYGNSKFYTAEN